jgi:hypothetical protein
LVNPDVSHGFVPERIDGFQFHDALLVAAYGNAIGAVSRTIVVHAELATAFVLSVAES